MGVKRIRPVETVNKDVKVILKKLINMLIKKGVMSEKELKEIGIEIEKNDLW